MHKNALVLQRFNVLIWHILSYTKKKHCHHDQTLTRAGDAGAMGLNAKRPLLTGGRTGVGRSI
ncbi:MAG: hypothetical protein VR68_11285 [Peptococcaceae bacterium BRH_c4a]|nr:MAG: hypothetical protein VR68_11285 [Peptococcaceae bacterium BRH_c4a]